MPRLSKEITIDVPGRDFGKVFVVTEMPTDEAVYWFGRACFSAGKSGIQLPIDAMATARESAEPYALLATLAAFAGQALLGLNWEDARELMTQLWRHIAIKPDPTKDETRPVDVSGDIEEVWTVMLLKRELLELHLGFSVKEELGRLIGSLEQQRQVALLLADVANRQAVAA